MKRVLLLATGGTIASTESKEGLAPAYTAEGLLRYMPELNDMCCIEGKLLMNVDSTNMQPEYWQEIARVVYANYAEYDGFVITHGTNTMGYTSAALSYMLQNLSKPVVITGAQQPIDREETDAKRNVIDSVRFVLEGGGGVFVVFDGRVILGTRAVKMKTKSYDAFASINSPYVAFIENDTVKFTGEVILDTGGEVTLDTSLCTDVFLLKLYPGLQPEVFDYLKECYKGVVIESFGLGGIPFEKRDLTSKVRELTEAGIAVVVTTQCLEEGIDLNLYEVGKKVAQNPIISGKDMTTEAIVTKLMWVLGRTDNLQRVKELMEQPISGDIRG
ncbi:MAG: asparaginase [Thermoanaerobacteraceae bacterium]|nr:asparaginase [Thermoanaerobacteraceae bacterium]